MGIHLEDSSIIVGSTRDSDTIEIARVILHQAERPIAVSTSSEAVQYLPCTIWTDVQCVHVSTPEVAATLRDTVQIALPIHHQPRGDRVLLVEGVQHALFAGWVQFEHRSAAKWWVAVLVAATQSSTEKIPPFVHEQGGITSVSPITLARECIKKAESLCL